MNELGHKTTTAVTTATTTGGTTMAVDVYHLL